MKRMPVRCMMLLICAMVITGCAPEPEPGPGDDLAMLARSMEGFTQATPGRQLTFPRDHNAHPDFRIEWWYLTANLEDVSGQFYGAQWTLFRIAMRPDSGQGGNASLVARQAPSKPELTEVDTASWGENPWLSGQVFMAHAALTWPQGHAGFQRYARGGDHAGIAQAGVRVEPFAAWLDDWSLRSTGDGWLPLQARFRQGDMGFSLRLDSDKPLVLQGEAGFSQKHASGSGSYYYSQPFLQAEGRLTVDGQDIPVTGQAWLDREWSSQFLQADQAGWDWFALHLDSGEKLMLFRLRQNQGLRQGGNFRHGVLISPQGAATQLDGQQIGFETLEFSLLHGRQLPVRWRITLTEIGREMIITPLLEDQWMDVDFAYWEGAIQAAGPTAGSTGRGYLEMTGYGAGQ